MYISTNTGGRRKISAQRRTCEKYKSDSDKCTKVMQNNNNNKKIIIIIKLSVLHPGSFRFWFEQCQPKHKI